MADETRAGKIKQFNQQSNASATAGGPLTQAGIGKDAGDKVDKNATAAEQIAQANEPETEGERLQRLQREEDARLKQRADATHLVVQGTQAAVDRVNSTIDPWKEWVAAQPTPGGILALLAFIIFFALAVIPVNDKGQTRLYLMWQTILGRTHLLYAETPNSNVQYGGGASGDFAASGASSGETSTTSANGTAAVIDLTHLNLFGF